MLLLSSRHRQGVIDFGGDIDILEDVRITFGHTKATYDVAFIRDLTFDTDLHIGIVSPLNRHAELRVSDTSRISPPLQFGAGFNLDSLQNSIDLNSSQNSISLDV